MKRERLRQVFKERFEDFDADNRCVTKFVISKDDGMWCVKLSCSIGIISRRYESPMGFHDSILYDIKDRCVWVGDFFYCRVDVRTHNSKVYITFHPLFK
jgi:hypothetical protein